MNGTGYSARNSGIVSSDGIVKAEDRAQADRAERDRQHAAQPTRSERTRRRPGHHRSAKARSSTRGSQTDDARDQPLAPRKEVHRREPSVTPAGRDAVVGDVRLLMVTRVVVAAQDDAVTLQPPNERRRRRHVRPLMHLIRRQRDQPQTPSARARLRRHVDADRQRAGRRRGTEYSASRRRRCSR